MVPLIPILGSVLEAYTEDRNRAKWSIIQNIIQLFVGVLRESEWQQTEQIVMKWLHQPLLITVSILGIFSSHMYDSYRCMEEFFKALTCLWIHNIWRIHVYPPKPHLTFSGYDESLMMTSIGFHIFGPQINKVVRGVGQWLSRGVCQRMHASLSVPANSRTQRAAVKCWC